MNGELTTPAVLDRVAAELPDRLALITEDRSLTFAQLRAEVRRAAAAMVARGVQAGDRVAIWAPNTWHWVVSALAAQYAGGVVVPVNTGYTAGEAEDLLLRSCARLLIAADRLSAELPPHCDIVRVPRDWEQFVNGPVVPMSEVDARAAAVRPDDVADIMFTSGTTGRSKGVVSTHRQSLSASSAAAESQGITAGDRCICIAPFFHTFGFKSGLLVSLHTGATLVTLRTVDPELALRMIAEHRVTVLPGPPTLFQLLLDHPARDQHDLSSLRLAAVGGAAIPRTLVERIRAELGADVATGYGLTESSGTGTICRPGDDDATVATTCGRPMPGIELRIAAPDAGGEGEILLRGPHVMRGYLDDPESTAAAIDDEGWLHTGDVGSVDAHGNLRISDRLTDMYICGGQNVYPAEVEQVLSRCDGVAAAAVIGVPDERLGEVGRAFVVAHPDADLDVAAVIAYARTQLAGFKVPRAVEFVDALPRNPGGKVLKIALREIPYAPPARVGVTPAGLGGPPVGPVELWVADAWQVLLNIPRPGRRDKFVDLGGDSLAAMEFSQMLQTQFGVSLSVDALADRPTIAAVVAGLQPGTGERRSPVVRLRESGTGPVVLMVPGIGGHAWVFAALAGALSVPCEVRAVSLMDLRDGDGDIRTRIHSTARDALQDAVAQGRPIVVAGYSFGALVAADLAGWLIDNGVPVARLVLLDPDPLDSSQSPLDFRTAASSDAAVVFVPGSPAARKLDDEITEVSRLLQDAYHHAPVRLPSTGVAWLQSRWMADRHALATRVFGTRVGEVDKTVLELDHLGVVQVPGVAQTARWLDAQLS